MEVARTELAAPQEFLLESAGYEFLPKEGKKVRIEETF